ncbi:MAG TPA: DinB family protein [Thermomicrobiales bacterium]|nr:DinB family protein [Thermomicrobiales bacterium]
MIDSDDIEQMLDDLREFPGYLRELIAGCEDAILVRAAPDGGWGAVEVFCHLRDIEELYVERVGRILTEDEPFMPAVDESLWPIEREYDKQQPRVALDEFARQRSHFVELLNDLDAPRWHRRGHHAELGDQTVLWCAAHAAEHDATHRRQLEELLQHD